MAYIPHTEHDIKKMLSACGKNSIDDLFATIPQQINLKKTLEIPEEHSESELLDFFAKMTAQNKVYNSCFLGAGSYRHFIPCAVKALTSQGAFFTAYTPYQAEASQGTLQAIYEYQSYITMLTGTDVANASLYDGATALCEAVIIALSEKKSKKIVIADSVHPEYKETLCTYNGCENITVIKTQKGHLNLELLEKEAEGAAAVVIQSPNFFGNIENIEKAAEIAHSKNALLIVVINELYSAILLKSAGMSGADIVVGDAQSFGNPTGFGGPSLGFMGVKTKLMRKIPGRLCGKTVDTDGNTGYVLTLQAREQHIRRDKSSSNICSNEALCALSASICLSLLGRSGLKEGAEQNIIKAHYMAEALSGIPGVKVHNSGSFFNEFVIETAASPQAINKELAKHNILGGLPLEKFYPEMQNCMLICATELSKKSDMDTFIDVVRTLSTGGTK